MQLAPTLRLWRILRGAIGFGLGLGAMTAVGCQKEPPAPPIAAPVDRTQDRAQVVQALLDSPWIQDALDSADDDTPQKPLVVVVPPDLQGRPLLAFGQSAQVLSLAQAQAQRPESFLELLDVHIDGGRARLKFRDEAEQVSGDAQLERSPKGWRVVEVTGTEH
jgi:hypothetical protein